MSRIVTPSSAITTLVRAGTDMTLRQIAVLAGVVETHGQSVGHLAKHLGIQKPCVTRAVDTLTADGYVTRTVAANDRRQVSIVATKPGVALVRRMDGRAA